MAYVPIGGGGGGKSSGGSSSKSAPSPGGSSGGYVPIGSSGGAVAAKSSKPEFTGFFSHAPGFSLLPHFAKTAVSDVTKPVDTFLTAADMGRRGVYATLRQGENLVPVSRAPGVTGPSWWNDFKSGQGVGNLYHDYGLDTNPTFGRAWKIAAALPTGGATLKLSDKSAAMWGARQGGLAGDIVTDPLTYIAPEAKPEVIASQAGEHLAAREAAGVASAVSRDMVQESARRGSSAFTKEAAKELTDAGMHLGPHAKLPFQRTLVAPALSHVAPDLANRLDQGAIGFGRVGTAAEKVLGAKKAFVAGVPFIGKDSALGQKLGTWAARNVAEKSGIDVEQQLRIARGAKVNGEKVAGDPIKAMGLVNQARSFGDVAQGFSRPHDEAMIASMKEAFAGVPKADRKNLVEHVGRAVVGDPASRKILRDAGVDVHTLDAAHAVFKSDAAFRGVRPADIAAAEQKVRTSPTMPRTSGADIGLLHHDVGVSFAQANAKQRLLETHGIQPFGNRCPHRS